MVSSILIVDDERPIRKGLRTVIERFHPQFKRIADSGTGAEALELAAIEPWDLVLTDICMNRMDGIEFMGRLKAIRPETQIIVISGHEDFASAREAMRYGALAWLLKPVDLKELAEAIGRANARHSAGSGQAAPMSTVPVADPPPAADERIHAVLRFIEDNLHRPLDMAEVANQTSFNYTYFSSWFKNAVGSNFNDYLARQRIERARRLLSDPALAVGDIARSVGYPDSRTFTKTFVRVTGTAPTVFRKAGCIGH
jgi:YesN/AraC family two-component response regulator